MWYLKKSLSYRWLLISLVSLAILAVACGSSAVQEPRVVEKEVIKEVIVEKEVIKEVEVVKEVIKEVIKEVPRAAVVEATVAPVKPDPQAVNPGKVVVLTGNFGNERFERAIGSGGSAHIGRILGGYLNGTNRQNEVLPGIATAWRYSADGLTLTYTIRKGVKFHDGSDLTAEDIAWTLRHTMSPEALEANVPLRGAPKRLSKSMEKVEQTGPDEVSLTGKKPLPQLVIQMSEASTSWFHMIQKREKIWDEEAAAAWDKKPIAAGKMALVGHTPSYLLAFERFDDYYYQPANGLPEDQRVKFQSLDMFLVPEEATRVAALRAGHADIIPVGLNSRKQVEAGGGRYVFARQGVILVGWLFGCDRPGSDLPCRDKRVRQALDYATPKQLLRDTLWGPEVYEIKGWYQVQEGTRAWWPEMENPRAFDPDKARALLKEAGYPGGKGFDEMIINTRPAASAPLLIESAQLVADTWRRELGIPVTVRVGEHAAIAEKRRNLDLEGQMWWREQGPTLDPTDTLQARWGDEKSTWRATDDMALIERVKKLISIVDNDERMAAFKPLIIDLQEETHYIMPGYLNVPFAVSSRVATWEPYDMMQHFSALHTLTLK